MLALLELDQYYIDEFSLEVNPSYPPTEEQEIDLDIDFEIGRADDGLPHFEVKLIIDVNASEERFRSCAYRIRLLVSGYFHFSEGTDEGQINRLILPNGLSILYGIARNTISQSTGVSRFGRFLLPSVNLIEVIKDKAKRDEVGQKRAK